MRYILFLSLFYFGFVLSMEAQPLRGKYSPQQLLETAEEQHEKKDYYQALEYYEKYYKEERDLDIAKRIADLYYQLRDYRKASRYYKRVVERKSRKKKNPFLPAAWFDYARTLKMNGEYPDALEQFTLFINETEDPVMAQRAKVEVEGIRMAQQMEEDSKVQLSNAGKKVNSRSSEYSPLLAAQDKMYFTGMRDDEIKELGSNANDYHSKLYLTVKDEDNDWGEPMEAGGVSINREGYHTGNIALNRDKTRMYFTRAKLQGNVLEESKLYYSDHTGDNWTPAKEVSSINGDYIVRQPAVGELFGNEVLYFVSDMDGGYGGYDIYYATKQGEGFTNPVNLGSVINTDLDEESPFYIDGNLYFSSEGHPGLGGFDIFKTTWNSNEWSKPENLGKPYNSSVDDLYYSVDEKGINGTMVSNREGGKSLLGKTCCTDIWLLTKEEVILALNASTFADGKALNGATVTIFEMTNNKPGMSDEKSNPSSNLFGFSLQPETSYMVIGRKEGYIADTITFNTVGFTSSSTLDKKLMLTMIPPPEPEVEYEEYTINETIELSNIYYDFDDATIKASAEADLTYLVELMNQYPSMKIELSSHTDSQGRKAYNKSLSQRRADSAKAWLISRGITADRIVAMGYGESQIRNKCVDGVACSDDEHQYNRRTEFKIIEGPTSIQIEKKRLLKK